MAKAADHIQIANRNHATLQYLLNDADAHLEWVVTVAFYKAVHVAEAVFHTCGGGHSTSHENRLNALKLRFGQIFLPFKHLYNASRVARYLVDLEGNQFRSFDDFMDKETVRTLIRKKLHLVEQQSILHLDDTTKRSLLKIDPVDFKNPAVPSVAVAAAAESVPPSQNLGA